MRRPARCWPWLRNAAQWEDARATRQAHQQGFGLIIAVMRRDNRVMTGGSGRIGQKRVTDLTRRRLQITPAGDLSCPDNLHRQAEMFCIFRNHGSLVGRFGPQAVIDSDNKHARALRPGYDKRHQRGRIRTAGDGEDETLCLSQIGEKRGGISQQRVVIAQQPAFFVSRATRSLRIDEASGNLLVTSEKVAQAASRSPSAASETPSFISASGALRPAGALL